MDDKNSAIFEGLNPQQHDAVEQTEGPVLIIAGAGSGKTRVLTCRVANLLDKGVNPEKILSLTFTKKAAEEMKERICGMVGRRSARGIVMGTFHSVFMRFLKDYAEFLGYPREFTIYDTGDSLSLIKTCLKELNLDDKVYKPKSVANRISDAKNNLVTPSSYMATHEAIEQDRRARMPQMAAIYDLYWTKCRKSGVMDFDDILFEMNILLRDNKEALEEISSRFDYIMVDEYQDTNKAQYIILKKLAQRHHNICVVGDDSQSIYAFRGARIENILNFRNDYPEYKIFRLEENYRSTANIVNAANSLIAHNENRIPKTCFSSAGDGEQLRILSGFNEQDEALAVVSAIMDTVRREGASYQDFAVLYRRNSQSRVLEECLRRRNIPYIIYSGNSFFERAEVKDVMAYFKLVCNPRDDESFKRIVNKPTRGIGDTSMAAFTAAALDNGLSLYETAALGNLESYGLKAASIARIRAFCDMIGKFVKLQSVTDAYRIAIDITNESGLALMFKQDMSVEGMARQANVDELCNSVKEYVEKCENDAYEDSLISDNADGNDAAPLVTLQQYLENVALLSAVDTDDDSSNKVSLMTAHSSKGLEFPHVFVVGMEEELFPSINNLSKPSEVEEERRLFYVAITRAMKSVHLSYCGSRMTNGQTQSHSPSRFLSEIDPKYIANPPRSELRRERAESFWHSIQTGSAGGGVTDGVRVQPFSRPGGTGGMRGSAPGGTGGVRGSAPGSTGGVRGSAPGSLKPGLGGVTGMGAAPAADFVPSPVMDLRVGQRVEHNRFGTGTIKELSVASGKTKIDFDAFGEKTLLLSYAKLRIIE